MWGAHIILFVFIFEFDLSQQSWHYVHGQFGEGAVMFPFFCPFSSSLRWSRASHSWGYGKAHLNISAAGCNVLRFTNLPRLHSGFCACQSGAKLLLAYPNKFIVLCQLHIGHYLWWWYITCACRVDYLYTEECLTSVLLIMMSIKGHKACEFMIYCLESWWQLMPGHYVVKDGPIDSRLFYAMYMNGVLNYFSSTRKANPVQVSCTMFTCSHYSWSI
jgi:hypothetical protein